MDWPFTITFNDVCWVLICFFLIPPLVRFLLDLLVKVLGVLFALGDWIEKLFEPRVLPFEPALLKRTRWLERWLGREFKPPAS